MSLVFRYTLFAVIAIVANIAAQDVTIQLYDGLYAVTASVIVGTGVGLVVKYELDKRYIFAYQVHNIAHQTQTFVLYTAMGVITTLVFWGFEFGFDYLFESKWMRYLGGVIGLVIGYLTKYQLDKRFVFISREV